MIILLDTNILIDVLRSRGNRRHLLADLVEQGHTLATSTINVGEVYAGMRPPEATETDRLLRSIESYPVTHAIARHAAAATTASDSQSLSERSPEALARSRPAAAAPPVHPHHPQ